MGLSVGQIFNVGTIILGAGFGIAAIALPQQSQIVGAIGAIVVPAWGAIGVALTTNTQQTQRVVDKLDTDSSVKQTVVEAVSKLKGIDPLQLNANADRTLIDMGASRDPSLAKVLAPKP